MSYITSDIKTGSIEQLRNLTPLELKQYDLFYCIEDGKEGNFKVDLTDTTSVDNLGTILVTTSGVRLKRVITNNEVYPEWFGAKGDGVTDDTVAINNSFDICNLIKKDLVLSGKTYLISSEIQKSIIGFNFRGIGYNVSKIKYSFGYACLKLTGMDNGGIIGISFVSTHSNSTEDQGYGMIYSYWTSIRNFTIKDCYFTNGNSNTSALSFYVNTTTSQTNIVSNFIIENNVFENIGRIGCTIMNKNPNKTLLEDFKFNRNHAINLGTQNSFGFLVSLDGYGQNGEVCENYIKNAFGIGIENTGYDNYLFSRNIFAGTTNYNPFGFSHPQTGEYITKNIITNNISIGLNRMPYFYDVSESTFSGNVFSSSVGNIAFLNCNTNTISNEQYFGLNYAFYIEASGSKTSNGNKISDCVFITSNNYSSVRCYGTNVTNNYFYNNKITYTGGVYFDELSGSSGNKFYRNLVNNSQTDLTENTFTTNVNVPSLKLTQMTTGSIPFVLNTQLSQDNSNLFFDNTNKRLGLSTNAPSTKLHIKATTGTDEVFVENTTLATSSVPQSSVLFTTKGSIWNSSLGSVAMKGGIQVNPVSYNVNPTIAKLSFVLGTDNTSPTEVGSIDNLGNISTKGADFVGNDVKIRNTTSATSSSPVDSKKLFFEGRAWNTTSGNIQNGAYLQYLNSVNNTNPVVGRLGIFTQAGVNNSGAYSEILSILSNGSVGINNISPNSSALLDLASTTKGFLPPRMTTAQINAIVSPVDGLTVYNTDLKCLCFYDVSSSWRKVSHSAM